MDRKVTLWRNGKPSLDCGWFNDYDEAATFSGGDVYALEVGKDIFDNCFEQSGNGYIVSPAKRGELGEIELRAIKASEEIINKYCQEEDCERTTRYEERHKWFKKLKQYAEGMIKTNRCEPGDVKGFSVVGENELPENVYYSFLFSFPKNIDTLSRQYVLLTGKGFRLLYEEDKFTKITKQEARGILRLAESAHLVGAA